MKIIILTITITLLGLSCQNSNEVSYNYKSGKYIYLNPITNKYSDSSFVIRTDSTQVYINLERGDTSISNINWTSENCYELIIIKSNRILTGRTQIGDTIIVYINPIDSITYEYSSYMTKFGMEEILFMGTMRKSK